MSVTVDGIPATALADMWVSRIRDTDLGFFAGAVLRLRGTGEDGDTVAEGPLTGDDLRLALTLRERMVDLLTERSELIGDGDALGRALTEVADALVPEPHSEVMAALAVTPSAWTRLAHRFGENVLTAEWIDRSPRGRWALKYDSARPNAVTSARRALLGVYTLHLQTALGWVDAEDRLNGGEG